MKLETISTGKTVEEAIDAGCKELGVERDAIDFEIIERPKRSFLGLKVTPAKVRVTVREIRDSAQSSTNDGMPMPEIIETSLQVGDLVKQQEKEERPERPRTRELVSDEEAAVPLEKAEAFLQQIFASMHLEVVIEREKSEDIFILNMSGDDLGILIGKHGQTLDSLQYLTNLAANHGLTEKRIHKVYVLAAPIGQIQHK